MTSYVIVTNIPESFRTPDLRNFFSEYIENEAFICFHFRHRPQAHLADLRKLTQNTNYKSERENIADQTGGRKVEDSCLSTRQIGPQKDVDKVNNYDSQMFNTESEGVAQNASECGKLLDTETNEHSTNVLSTSGSENLLGSELPNVKSHWLNTGLLGLSSLISEKKQKAKSDWRASLQSSRTKDDKATVSHSSSLRSPKNERRLTKDKIIEEKASTSTMSLEDMIKHSSSSESIKRTCCILKIKNNFLESFILKYDRKHWVDRTGEVLVPRCYLIRVEFSENTNNGM